MNSWRTTIFGLLAAIGAAVLAGIQTGAIDATHLPSWLKGVAGLLSVLGTAGLGISARDNNKTSEQVGATPGTNIPIRTLVGLLILSVLGVWLMLSAVSCGTTPAAKATQVERIVIHSVNDAMTEWAARVNAGKATQAQVDAVKKGYGDYLAAQAVAKAAIEKAAIAEQAGQPATGDVDTANQAVSNAETALINLINSFL